MKKKADTLSPTPERLARDEWVQVLTERAGVTTVQTVTQEPIDRYYQRGQLDHSPADNATLYEAGKQLRQAWHRSGLGASVTGGWEQGVQSTTDPDMRMVGALDASHAYRRMIGMISDPAPVIYCVCWGEPIGAGRGMDRLRCGLAELARGLGI